MNYTTIITTDELATLMEAKDILLVDCRFELAYPDSGYEMYLADHLPGAVYCDLNQQMSSKPTPTTSRHPLPDLHSFQTLLSDWGVDPSTQVIVYDAEGGAMAACRLWWMLKACGHENAAILDGGYPKWLIENRPTESTLPQPRKRVKNEYVIAPETYLSTIQMERIYRDPSWLMIDARSALRFSGYEDQVDPISGHIPNAINLPYAQLLDGTGKLLPKPVLSEILNTLLSNHNPEKTVVYCGSGVTSILVLVAMEWCGIKGARLYPGSWSEWIRDSKHEIAAGIHPNQF